jgi:tetratricopeptide (TPR) repeat protein
MIVELTPSGGGPTEQAVVSGDGSFDLPAIDPGYYELRVSTLGGAILYSEGVLISNSRRSLSIRIPDAPTPVRPVEGAVSIQQLMHKAPPEARKAFEKGRQAEIKGNHQQAAELFHQAVSIDPEFADAFNGLGAAEAGKGDYAQAIESFQKAIDVAPDHPLALANLSIMLDKTGRYDEAVPVARRALQFMPSSSTIRYVLATSMLFGKGESDEVLEDLERSASDIPSAHLLAAEILDHRGKRVEAVRHLEDFLRAAPSNDKQRSRAETMLARLKQ